MTRADATAAAKKEVANLKLTIAIVREGLHADEYAELDRDGESYGYCLVQALPLLYRFGVVVDTIEPASVD